MTGSSRSVPATSIRPLPLMGCVAGGLLLTACSGNWKQAVGLQPTSPDEFAVESRARDCAHLAAAFLRKVSGARPPTEILQDLIASVRADRENHDDEARRADSKKS